MKQFLSRLPVLLFAFAAAVMLSSCNKTVDPGYIGMVQKPGGLTGVVLQPGHHTCWGRDKMILVENAETNYQSHMDVLCKDELNFSFDVNVLARLRINTEGEDEKIKNILDRQGGKIIWSGKKGIIDFDVLYSTYVAPKVDAISRSVVSKYETTQIRENRDKIEAEIMLQIIAATIDTPIEVVSVVNSNFDYPDIITQAQEKKKQREIQLEEEDANQALEMKRMQNRKLLATENVVVRAKEAEAEKVYNVIVGSSLTQSYLKLRALENQKILYSTSGVEKIIVPEGSTPFIQ